jgi:hypothetical protein
LVALCKLHICVGKENAKKNEQQHGRGGLRGIGARGGPKKNQWFFESLARPHVVTDELAKGYKAMVQDDKREQEALAWSEALIVDSQGKASHEVR